MATVTEVLRVQPAPGKFAQCLELGKKFKKLRERHGAKERLFRTATGTLIVVIETSGWKQFGEVSAGMASDQAARDLFASFENDPNPVGTILSVEIVEEIEV
jgi:hypothetical protein